MNPSYASAIARKLQDSPLRDFWHSDLETHVTPKEAPSGNRVFQLRFPSADRSIDDVPEWSISEFADRVGANGWNYKNQTAEFAIFESDFGHGTNAQTAEQLEENDAALRGRATIHTSTGGSGRHYRVRFAEPVPCRSLSEYNALCRYTAHEHGMTDKTCARGGFLWIEAEGAKGFQLISEQTELFVVPENWQPPVQRMRVGHKTVELSDRHNRVLNYLADHGHPLIPKPLEGGGECYATSTLSLKACHQAEGLLGAYSTCSTGSTEFNCYMIPREDGGFQVFRYGTAKEPGWNVRQRDERSWCWFNSFDPDSDWAALCTAHRGVSRTGKKKGTYTFAKFADAQAVVQGAGGTLALSLSDRPISLRFADQAILCEVDHAKDEPIPDDWIDLGKAFARTVGVVGGSVDRSNNAPVQGVKVGYHFSDVGRQDGATVAYIEHADGTWKPETEDHISAALKSEGVHPAAIQHWWGEQIRSPLKISNKPFAKDSADPSVWNRGFKFTCEPVPGLHPHWDKVLKHTGKYLDPYVADDPWCQANNIRTGYDYLLVYCSVMAQHPEWRVIQLFLQSIATGTGKNTFADMLALLMEYGAVVDGTQAAFSENGFNHELEGVVVCTLNEVDVSKKGSTAESRCREWVYNPHLSIHKKGITPFTVVNYLRVIQTANSLSYKMIDAEDSRVVVIVLSPIPEDQWLDWTTELKPALIAERAHFLHTILNYQLPERGAKKSRGYLPVLNTEAKQQAIAEGLPPLSEEHQRLFDQTLAKALAADWTEPLDHKAISTLLVDVPANARRWGSVWNKITPHLKSAGLNPIHCDRIEHVSPARWGFSK